MSKIKKLPIADIVTKALLMPWKLRKEFSSKLLIPVLIYALIALIEWLIESTYPKGQVFFPLLSLFIYGLFAITCHRIVILGSNSVPSYGFKKWSMRETKFYARMIIIFLVLAVIGNSVGFIMIFVVPDVKGPFEMELFITWLPEIMIGTIVGYFFARICLLFPAIAIDEHVDYRWAWNISNGNGWRLVVVIAILPMFTSAVLSLLNVLYGEYFVVDMLLSILAWILTIIALIIEITAISLSYLELHNGTQTGRRE